MVIKHMKEKIRNINNFIMMIVDLLNISKPYIYYISYKDDFILYDENLNIVSYDERDVNIKVSSLKYVVKENTLYINLTATNNIVRTYALILRTLRGVYQIDQATRYDKRLECDRYASNYYHIYFNNITEDNDSEDIRINSIDNIDKFAFVQVLMKRIFNINIDTEQLEKQIYVPRLKELSEIYHQELIDELIKKYKINPYL